MWKHVLIWEKFKNNKTLESNSLNCNHLHNSNFEQEGYSLWWMPVQSCAVPTPPVWNTDGDQPPKTEMGVKPSFHCCNTAVNIVLLISILQCGFLTVLRASFTRSSSRLAWMWTAKDGELFIIANLIPYSTWPLYDQRIIRTLDGNIIWSGSRSSINQANKP